MRYAHRHLRAILAASLPLLALAALLTPTAVGAAGEEAAIANRLVSSGIKIMSVSTSGAIVTVEYAQPVAEIGSVVDMLQTVGTILAAVAAELPSAQSCDIVQYFDDGQIMQVSGSPSDGAAFMSQRLTAEEFMGSLVFRPLTRGPMLVPGQCEPGIGEDCSNCAECPCYPNETCEPGNPQADERGCVAGAPPANAHLVGSEYVCNDGYEWNSDLSACVAAMQCPPNAFSFDGDCHCEPGYEWNAAGTACVPVQSTGGSGGGAPAGSGRNVFDKLMDLIDSIVNWVKSLF